MSKIAKKHAVAYILDAGLYPQDIYLKRGITPRKIVVLIGIRYIDGCHIKKFDLEKAIEHWHDTGSIYYPIIPTQKDNASLRAMRDMRLLKSATNAAARNLKNKHEVVDDFYSSKEWRNLRYLALSLCEGKCTCCGRSAAEHGIVLHVDHIKPRSLYPELSLQLKNLQILCEDCNIGKSNLDDFDFRSAQAKKALSEA